MAALKTLIEPTEEPVSIADVCAAARIDGSEFDSQLGLVIPALRRHAEARTQRRFVTQTVVLTLDAFPACEVDLQVPSVQSIASVKYIDVDGVEQTLASDRYSLDGQSTPCWLLPAADTDWPETHETANAVAITFVVGFGGAAAVPADIKLWLVAHAVQVLRSPDGLANGVQPLPFVDRLLDQYIVWRAM